MQGSKVPNLNALRVFESAARLGSFTSAAAEVGLTQPSVSKQIADLEFVLGQQLFHRYHKRIELTPFGQEIAQIVRDNLFQLQAGLHAAKTKSSHQIKIAADADFVNLWLFPRLSEFEKDNPRIRLSITAIIGLNSPPPTDFDCAIIWGRGNWSEVMVEHLIENAVFPVSSPKFFDFLQNPPTINDVTDGMLIHDQSTYWWSAFLSNINGGVFSPAAGRIYNLSSLCLEAASRGDGLTIGDEVTARSYLESGQLICQFDAKLRSPDSYYLILPPTRSIQKDLQVFLEWLKDEVSRHRSWYKSFWAD